DLLFGKIDLASESAEHANHAPPDLGVELIAEAREKEGDLHSTGPVRKRAFRHKMTLTAAGPCTPMERSFSMSLVLLGPVTKWTADGMTSCARYPSSAVPSRSTSWSSRTRARWTVGKRLTARGRAELAERASVPVFTIARSTVVMPMSARSARSRKRA